MLEFLLIDANAPARIALLVLGVLVILELIGVIIGLSASAMVDDFVDVPDPHIDADVGPLDATLSWLGLGKVPFMVWLVGHLTLTASITLLINFVLLEVGTSPSTWLAIVASQAGAIFGNHFLCRKLARIIPKDTTTAVHPSSFVGRRALIIGGNARLDLPSQAKLIDEHNRGHYVLVKPYRNTIIPNDSWVILMSREDDGSFTAIEDHETDH